VGRGFFFYTYLIQSTRPYTEYKKEQIIIYKNFQGLYSANVSKRPYTEYKKEQIIINKVCTVQTFPRDLIQSIRRSRK